MKICNRILSIVLSFTLSLTSLRGPWIQTSYAQIQPLSISSFCPPGVDPSPGTPLQWKITNPNTAPVNVIWRISGSTTEGSFSVRPGEHLITTPSRGRPGNATNVTFIYDNERVSENKSHTCDPGTIDVPPSTDEDTTGTGGTDDGGSDGTTGGDDTAAEDDDGSDTTVGEESTGEELTVAGSLNNSGKGREDLIRYITFLGSIFVGLSLVWPGKCHQGPILGLKPSAGLYAAGALTNAIAEVQAFFEFVRVTDQIEKAYTTDNEEEARKQVKAFVHARRVLEKAKSVLERKMQLLKVSRGVFAASSAAAIAEAIYMGVKMTPPASVPYLSAYGAEKAAVLGHSAATQALVQSGVVTLVKSFGFSPAEVAKMIATGSASTTLAHKQNIAHAKSLTPGVHDMFCNITPWNLSSPTPPGTGGPGAGFNSPPNMTYMPIPLVPTHLITKAVEASSQDIDAYFVYHEQLQFWSGKGNASPSLNQYNEAININHSVETMGTELGHFSWKKLALDSLKFMAMIPKLLAMPEAHAFSLPHLDPQKTALAVAGVMIMLSLHDPIDAAMMPAIAQPGGRFAIFGATAVLANQVYQAAEGQRNRLKTRIKQYNKIIKRLDPVGHQYIEAEDTSSSTSTDTGDNDE